MSGGGLHHHRGGRAVVDAPDCQREIDRRQQQADRGGQFARRPEAAARANRRGDQELERGDVKREDDVGAERRRGAPREDLQQQRGCEHSGADTDGVNGLHAQVESFDEMRAFEIALRHLSGDDLRQGAVPIALDHLLEREASPGRREKEERPTHQIQLQRVQVRAASSGHELGRQQPRRHQRIQRAQGHELGAEAGDLVDHVVGEPGRREVFGPHSPFAAGRAVFADQFSQAVRAAIHGHRIDIPDC